MSPRARPLAARLAGAVLALAVLALAARALAAKASTFTIDYAPLGFKVAIAVPEEGQLCIIVPESAQDPVACLGLDASTMIEALPKGPDAPFGVAYARMGEWSYIVMLAPIGGGIASKEDIDEFVAGAAKPDPELPGVVPQLVGPSPDKKYEIVRVKDVPIVKFRLDAGVPKDSPNYDVSTMVQYAAFGGKTALVSFITSPKDADRMMPYADASIQSLVLPPRERPERFGLPRSELEGSGPRKAVMVLGPLLAFGGLLFLWLARSKKEEPEAAKPRRAAKKDEDEDAAEDDDAEDDDAEGDDAEDGEGDEGGEDGKDGRGK
jgi:hypothetical protein